jgi:hypothetical protein
MRRFTLGLIVVFILPAAAAAKDRTHTIAPPGNSGVSQYVETIPTAKGGQPTSSVQNGGGGSTHSRGGGGGTSGGGGPGSGGGSAISTPTKRALDSQGADGRAAAAVLSATAPTGRVSITAGQGGTAGGGRAGAGNADTGPGAAGSSPASAVFKTLTGSAASGGLGPLLPIILVASLVALSALAIMRGRRTTT